MDDVMPSTLRIFRAAAASADRLVVYDDDDDVMMMEWAFDETLQEATKGYGNDAIDAAAPSRHLVTRQHV